MVSVMAPTTLVGAEASPGDIEQDQPRGSLLDVTYQLVSHNWISHYKARRKASATDPLMLEIFSGIEATPHLFSFYAGGVSSALWPFITQEGVRLKAVHGASFYHYYSNRQVGGQSVRSKFQGRSIFYEALVGYEFQFQGSIFKIYGGLISIDHDIDPRDVSNALQGKTVGAKFQFEAWREFYQDSWISAYGSFSTANDYYNVHGQIGTLLFWDLKGGIEFGAFGDEEYDALRLGGFTRFQLGKGTFTFSAGVAGDYNEPDVFYTRAKFSSKLHLSDLEVLGFIGQGD